MHQEGDGSEVVVEMPEGWKFLDSDIPEGYQLHRIERALDLMKEMAEVMEKVSTVANNLLKMRDDINKYAHLNPEVIVSFIDPALKKFKEWR